MHTPVLLQPALDALNIRKGGLYIDATFGQGGYSREILKRGGRVLAIDYDGSQARWLNKSDKMILVVDNFSRIESLAKSYGFFPADGVVADLGLSMDQLAGNGRGFSYKNDQDPLDMRINKSSEVSGCDIINSYSQEKLYEVFSKNSEEVNSRSVADAVVVSRRIKKIETVGDLKKIIDGVVGREDARTKARIFQALRIEVNQEFANLKLFLEGAVGILKKEGRLVVVTFHSLEDRIVKSFARNRGFKETGKKNFGFQKRSRFERSAMLRVISKI
jgi:16S rRNA (cytosine1402-N4)-methyltransferase